MTNSTYIFNVHHNRDLMPTYEYRCSECGHTLEEFQSMKAEPLALCPQCGRSTLKRLIGGGGGMIFKGSGFYLTDYRKKGVKGKKSSSPSTKKDEKGDSKDTPAQKPATKEKSDSKSGTS